MKRVPYYLISGLMTIWCILLLPCREALAATRLPQELKCEYLINPIGVDQANPRFSWLMQDTNPGATQTAYQIIIGTDSSAVARSEGDVWNSGKVNSALNLVSYNGVRLKPFTRYYWTVLIWDAQRQPLSRAAVCFFETGMMQATNWKGSWISDGHAIDFRPAPYFRKRFAVSRKIRFARAYIAAAGLYELSINGKKTGNHRLDPMYTRFDRRNLYVSYDVTTALKKGENVIGVVLGNGWYNHQPIAVWDFDKAPWRNRPTFCLNLRITYEDGSQDIVSTDKSWKTSTGPIVSSNIYTGEHYNANLEMPGWNTVSFDDAKWTPAMRRAAPSQNIVSQLMHPIRNVEWIPAQSLKQFSDTSYVFDLGRNISGVSSIRLSGDSGTVVRIKHGERLTRSGHVDLSNIDVYYRPTDHADPFQTDIVILNGKGETRFMPRFNYKGFRYVEVSSSHPLMLKQQDLEAWFMHSDVPAVGQIQCSNPLITKIWEATNHSYLSNLFGYPTDCPQREKNGWTGDAHFAIQSALYNFDGITVYEKWLADHRDEQRPNGVLPDIIPTGGWGYGTANGTDWTSTIAIIPWELYLFYGDSKPLADNYEAIKKYVGYVDSISSNGLTSFGRGDWVPVKSKASLELTSSIYFYADVTILTKAARLLGKTADSKRYERLAQKIKTAINDKYFNPQTGLYNNGLQTELSLPLLWNVVPQGYQRLVASKLADRVRADKLHLDVGVLGARAILDALSDNGQSEIAYQLAAQDTYPSWGWWIKNGATTLYENWDLEATRDISFNHMMFGAVGGWLFRGLAGIVPDEAQPGFRHIRLRPHFVTGLDQFQARHRGRYGVISSGWKRTAGSIEYEVIIPPGSTASLSLDLPKGTRCYLKGKALVAPIHLVAGTYQFSIR